MARILGPMFALALCCCASWAQKTAPAASSANAAASVAGKVELVEGDVTVYDRAKAPRRVRIGDPLYEGEAVVTGRDGELHVAMDDGAYLAVRPNTNMGIVAYQARGRADDRSILNLVVGSFRSITGWIGRYNPASYQVQTPTATIGIRGTDHEPLVIAEGAGNGEAGTYDKVNAGGTFIESRRDRARIDVTPNRAGFAPLRGRATPRLLAEVPRFYRAGRNEQRLVQKHQAVQRNLGRLREERRRVIEERRTMPQERKDARKAESRREHDRRDWEQRREAQDARRKQVEQRREQQQERTWHVEDKRQRVEARKREEREHAKRGRNRD